MKILYHKGISLVRAAKLLNSALSFVFIICFFLGMASMATVHANTDGQAPIPPALPVKLLFIHHSVGGQWLAHANGGLVNELNKNNFYVNDVTYGWEPSSLTSTLFKKIIRKVLGKLGKGEQGAYDIGNRTDIGQMPEWFLGPDSSLIMASLYKENLETDSYGDHSNSHSRKPHKNPDPSAENQVIMFKSCFPNTILKGNPDDLAAPISDHESSFTAGSDKHTVANAKRVFNDVLVYFGKHPDKFFVVVTPPPQTELPENGRVARGFSNWLVKDWLKENHYTLNNVMVFDLYNVLTSGHGSQQNDAGEEEGNHHRVWNGEVQHVVHVDNNLLAYPSKEGDSHPSPAGLRKATQELVPLLNHYYNIWRNIH